MCRNCYRHLAGIGSRCYICRKPSSDYSVCADCSSKSSLRLVLPATIYDEIGRHLVVSLKLGGARDVAKSMSEIIIQRHRLDVNAVLVPLPTAANRARMRGFDQAKLLARLLARRSGLEYRDLLHRSGKTSQHGLGRQERLLQLGQSFQVKRMADLPEKVFLVDDVVTTGATIESAAKILLSAGVKQVSAVVFAQPEFIRLNHPLEH